MPPPDYTYDDKRLATLRGFDILDTPTETGFEGIVHLAAQICDAPVSLVSFVTEDRQWFKARVGFEACETDLSRSVCAHVLTEPDLLVIDDLSKDPRTQANPLVTGQPHIRFYAGAPLRAANNEVLGSLCVIDGQPRPGGLTAPQAEGLRLLAQQVMAQMELRRALVERDTLLADSRHAETRRNGLLAIGDRLRAVDTISEATSETARIVGQTLGLVRAGFGRIDATGEFFDIEADWTASGFVSLAGRHFLSEYGELRKDIVSGEGLFVEDVAADPRTAFLRDVLVSRGTRAFAKLPVRDQGGGVAFFFAHSDQPRAWTPGDLSFLRNVGDRVAASVARYEAEAHQRFLNLELSHRMKNTLSIVQAVAKLTLRAVPDQAPVEAFVSRLKALSTAHETLLHQSWTAAKIGDVVASVVAIVEKIDRFTINGPPINLGSRATLSVSLLLHELSTNALKYGALSQPDGHVFISWTVTDDNLVFAWREAKGPSVVPPARKGFGSRLISLGLVGTGGATVTYSEIGFEAVFRASLSELSEA